MSQLNRVEVIEHTWIKMSDGVRLSSKIWLPIDDLKNPVPAILEFIPYRKRDSYAIRDHSNHYWFAERGYACLRPDMRGHGDSEGLMTDEYSPREQQDTLELIEWIAKQPWCNGNVGMMGLSWGGIASLQAAMNQSKHLKAIVPVGSSLDRYYDDGGYLVGGYPGQGLGWGGIMFGYCIRPPDPKVVGKDWRDMWFERLNKTPMFAEKWLSHQLRDETWTQGSVCENYSSINTPVLGFSGWNDCWPNTMIRLLENINSCCRVVSGPWGHVYPNLGGPGPMIGFLQLALKWWDYWLKGIENNILNELPEFCAFIQESHVPDPHANSRPGRWVREIEWPSKNIETKSYYLHDGKLEINPLERELGLTLCSPLTLGLSTGEYMPVSGTAELPQEQKYDDKASICFDTSPLLNSIEILGTSFVNIRLSCNSDNGIIAARLCDISPEGNSTLITFGILNLKLREGREKNTSINPGQHMDVIVRLNDTGWSIKKGHQLRLALSSQLWPMAWPTSEQSILNVDLKFCKLNLPVRTPYSNESLNNFLEEPVAAKPIPHRILTPEHEKRTVKKNIDTGQVVYDVYNYGSDVYFSEIDLRYGSFNSQHYLIREGEPLSARNVYKSAFKFSRNGWDVKTKSEMTVTCDESHFFLKAKVMAYEDKNEVFSRDWNLKIPRDVY